MKREEYFGNFLDMEIHYHLFDVTDKSGFPCWDFVRVDIYNENLAEIHKNINSRHNKSLIQKLRKIIIYIIKGIVSPKKKNPIMFVYCPRFFDKDNLLYDRVAEDLIDYAKPYNCVYLNTSNNFERTREKDNTLFLFELRAMIKTMGCKIDRGVYDFFYKALKEKFDVDISYEVINSYFISKVREYYTYYYCLKFFSPQKIIVSRDRKKGLYWAARKLNIPTYELQHGTLVYEYPSYSYPKGIDNSSNVAFADYFIKPGDGWGVNNVLPAKKSLILGNNNFVSQGNGEAFDKGIILIISSHIQAQFLKPLAKDIATKLGLKVVYRLHPQEYKDVDNYKDYFKDVDNQVIIDLKGNLQKLIQNCSLMITISSTVYFEAKSHGKRVAVFMKDNYYILKDYVMLSENSCFIENADDVLKALKMPENVSSVQYYKKFDVNIARQIITE